MHTDITLSSIIRDPNIDQLKELHKEIFARSKAKGATDVEISAVLSNSLNVNVLTGNIESLEYSKEKNITITVYINKATGTSSTTDLGKESIYSAIDAAVNIAKSVSEDKFSGLADKELMAFDYPDLDLYCPWGISAQELMNKALECEEIAMNRSDKITNSDGVSISTEESFYLYANTNGFIGYYPYSSHSISCALIAGETDNMQKEYDYSVSRDSKALLGVSKLASIVVDKTISRLGAKSLATRKCPVVFHSDISSTLINYLMSAISGDSQYRESTFLLNSIESQVLPEWINIQENPHKLQGLGSRPFDADGVRTMNNLFIENGRVKKYVLDTYTAKRLNMHNTGNASGFANLTITDSKINFKQLLATMGTGLLVTRLLGHGVNIVTGGFSLGIAGFWVENGVIQFPVEEVTIASNLKVMLKNIAAIANDINTNKNTLLGSLLIEQMTIAGKSG